ncbi:MAG: archease [Candidatus Omnitrophica bacterium]|nr:archease [Candidatus Omnitrophota bacterium]
MKRYEEIPHTADIALRVYGKDLRELFSNAAFGMFDIIADLSGLKKSVAVDVKLEAPSAEELLVSWLDELLYNFYTKGIIFFDFDIIDISSTRIMAHANGRHLGSNRNRLKTEIKAATYHDLTIKEIDGRYSVDIVFDV